MTSSGVGAVTAAAITACATPEVIGRRHDEEAGVGIEVPVFAACFSEVVGRLRGLGDGRITVGVGHPLSIPMLK